MRVLTVVLILLASGAAPPAAAQRQLNERFAASPNGHIRIQNLVGSVTVTGWTRDSVVVTGAVAETGTDRFEVHRGNGGAKMGFFGTATDLAPSHIDVRLPEGTQLWIKTASADVVVRGMTGGLDVYSVSGRIDVAGTPREVFAESMTGAIEVAADTRTVRAKSASGDITVRGEVSDVVATTVSGGVTAEGSAFERGRFESVEGDVRYLGEIPRGGWLDFINHSGTVEFVVPRSTAAAFEVTTFEGGFDDRIGVRAASGGNDLKGRRLTFTMGGGGSTVTVRNFKGPTILRAMPAGREP